MADARARRAREPFSAESVKAKPAHQPCKSDVDRDKTQMFSGGREFEIVDAHDFAAVDVEDLPIEQLAIEEQLVIGRPFVLLVMGSLVEDHRPIADRTHRVERREAYDPVAALDVQAGDGRKIVAAVDDQVLDTADRHARAVRPQLDGAAY